jgi:hypothetical protein
MGNSIYVTCDFIEDKNKSSSHHLSIIGRSYSADIYNTSALRILEEWLEWTITSNVTGESKTINWIINLPDGELWVTQSSAAKLSDNIGVTLCWWISLIVFTTTHHHQISI